MLIVSLFHFDHLAFAGEGEPTSFFIDFEDFRAKPSYCENGTCYAFPCETNGSPHLLIYNGSVCDFNYRAANGTRMFSSLLAGEIEGKAAIQQNVIYLGGKISLGFPKHLNPEYAYITRLILTVTNVAFDNSDLSSPLRPVYFGVKIDGYGGPEINIPSAKKFNALIEADPTGYIEWVNIEGGGGTALFIDNIQIETKRPEYSLSLEIESDQVQPIHKSSGNLSETKLTAKLKERSSSRVSGQYVEFSSLRVEGSGGHLHGGVMPVGSFSPSYCITGLDGSCTVTYRASEVSGREIVTAKLTQDASISDSKLVDVKVPGLFEVLPQPDLYRLTGERTSHPMNHYLSPAAIGIFDVAQYILDRLNATIGFNDMSLEGGGLFDIGLPEFPFWEPPHKAHRLGKSVDIDRCAKSTIKNNPNPRETCEAGFVRLPKKLFGSACRQFYGKVEREKTYHCEFK